MSDQHEETTAENTKSDRPLRELDGSGMRKERRVIKRIGDPELRKNVTQIKVISRITALTAFTFAAALLIHHFWGNSLQLTRSLFFATLSVVEGACLYSLSNAAASYGENESVARLTRFTDRLVLLLIVSTALAITFAGAQIAAWVW